MFNRNPGPPDRYQAPGSARPGSPFAWGTGAGVPTADARVGVAPREGFLTLSFVWMFLALLASAGAAAFVMTNPSALQFVARNYFLLMIGTFVLAMVIQLGINRIGAIPALAMLFVYSLMMGATIGAIVTAYFAAGQASGVVAAFLGASSIFGAAALYGVVTKRDLTRIGGLLFMAFIGLFVMMLVNIFLRADTLSFIIGIAGVVIFTGLTAYYVQQLNTGQLHYVRDREAASVVGALLLYISFINLFLFLLSLFGGGNRD